MDKEFVFANSPAPPQTGPGAHIASSKCTGAYWRNKAAGKIYGPTKENGQWRIKTNEELRTKHKSQDIVTVIKIRRLEWLGHVIRMNETRGVKRICEGKLEGRRDRGRPRLRWIHDVEDDLRKLGVKRWRTKALDREEWASIVREAKGKLKGP